MEKEKDMKVAYVERDLSWMYFNHRILQEAEKNSRECRSSESIQTTSTSSSV